MRELDRQAVDDLIALYEDAAAQVRGAIAQRVDAYDQVSLAQLRELLRQVDQVLEQLGHQRDDLLAAHLDDAARLGVRPFTAAGVGAASGGEAVHAVVAADAAMRIHQEAVEFVRAFKAADGLVLSDRLWRLDQGAKETLQRAIGNAVVQGWSATRAAADLAYRGQAVPADVTRAIEAGQAPALRRLADLLLTGDGGEQWKAERVFRTEINRAHGEAFTSAGERTPGFAGWRYLLSPAHPEPDICDLLAAQNIHGLGSGVYPDRARTPWPAHPNTLSFLEIVFADEVSEADRVGKESELQALARLAPEIRAGVLGQTKAQYFDAGLLRRGMLRSPLRAVQARLRRQGKPVRPEAPPATPSVVRRFVERSAGGKTDERLTLGPAGSMAAQHTQKALGREISGFPRTLEAAAVRHILARHGGAGEKDRGQLPVVAADFALLQELLLNGTRTLMDRRSRGSPVVEVRATFGGVEYTVMEVLRSRDVTVQSMWKRQQRK